MHTPHTSTPPLSSARSGQTSLAECQSNHHSAMENSSGSASNGEVAAAFRVPDSWNFEPNERLLGLMSLSVRGVLAKIKAEMGAAGGGGRPVIPMGHGDPSAFPCFRTAPEAVDAVAGALQSGEYNSYSTCVGLEPARR